MCVRERERAEAEGVGQKDDRSAANRSGMRKVENLVFAWLQVCSYLLATPTALRGPCN